MKRKIMVGENVMPYLFCNIGWMEYYKGQGTHDQIKGGGEYVKKEGHGHEVCNFAEVRQYFYGYVQPTGEQVKVERLGADKSEEEISGVTVIWTAKRPEGGTVVIGWYKDATVYRYFRHFKKIPTLQKKNGVDGYRIKAEASNVKLLPLDERTIEIPRNIKGGMGKSNVWYADSPESEKLLNKIKKIISGKVVKVKANRSKKTDPEKNAKVEKAAIKAVTDYFESKGYTVDSVEKDNAGWDLEVVSGKKKLCVEVKGLSGNGLVIELTPNEYTAFQNEKSNYRLCVVHSALTEPTLLICRFSLEIGSWTVEGDIHAEIEIKPKQSASIQIHI